MARLTIPDEQTFATFTVTTSTSAFPITFSLFAKADLSVIANGVVLAQSAFTFTGTLLEGGGYDGGTVTLNTAVATGTVIIRRDVTPARASNFAPANSVPVASVDQALNRLTANMQDVRRDAARSLKMPLGSTPEDVVGNPANKFLAFDADGDAIFSSGTGADAGLRTDLAASGGAALVRYKQDDTDALAASVQAKIAADVPLNIRTDFGAVGDGTTDDGPAFQKASDFGQGRPIHVPLGYTFAIKTTVTVAPIPLIDATPTPPSVPGAFAPGLWLVGDGMAESVIRPMVPDGVAFDIDVTTPDELTPPGDYEYRAQQGIRVENIAFIGANTPANSSVFKLRNAYQAKFSQCHIRNMTGSGIVMVNGDFPDDGWNMVAFDGLWIEACQQWGIDATGSVTRNEGSFTHMKHVFIQGCGKNEYFHITGISNASPAVVTVSPLQIPTVFPERSAHLFVAGDRVKLWGINSTVTLGADPITTVSGSAAVTIADTAHGFSEGDNIFFAGATAVGGITIAGAYQVAAVASANTFMILHSSAASGSATGGGSAVTLRAPMTGLNELDRYVGPSPTATTFSLYQASGTAIATGTDPLATTSESATVTVTAAAHGLSVSNRVVISEASAVGGLTINKLYTVASTPTVNTFTITAASNATSTATGGGANVKVQLVVAVDSTSYGTLYNPLSAVTINTNPFATTSGSATVTVTDTAHGADSTDTVTFLPRALGNNPLGTTNGSPTVTVTLTAHGLAVSDQVSIASAADTGGLTINGAYTVVSTPTADTFTITDDTNATSTATGGGASATLVKMVGGVAVSGEYRLTKIDANTYTINHSSAATSTATGGGAAVDAIYYKQLGVSVPEVGYYEPQSGGMRWKGQLLHMDQCGFTVNQNCAFYVKGQSGLGIGVLTHAVTWENNYRRHVFCTGITNWRSEGCQFHGNQSYKTWAGVDFDAQDFTVRGVQWVNTKVRARLGEGYAFRLAGTNAAGNSCRVRTTIWDDFDYTNQRRFIGWQFDQVEDDCLLRNAGATAVTFGPPSGFATGNKTVLRMRGPDNSVAGGVASRTGEWVEWRIPNTGVTLLNSSLDDEGAAITANTLYNIYLYDDDGTPKIVASTVAETIDTTHGYMVKTTNSSKRWIGRIKTESASTDFIQTSTQFLVPLTLSGSQLGVGEHFWWDPTNGGRYWQKSGTLPTTTSGGTVALRPALEFNTTTDLGSIAAGASLEFTIAAPDVKTQDAVVAVSSSANNSLMLTGRVSADDVVTVTVFNPTGGAIDPLNATYRAFVIRR
jgi:hypothetical protein